MLGAQDKQGFELRHERRRRIYVQQKTFATVVDGSETFEAYLLDYSVSGLGLALNYDSDKPQFTVGKSYHICISSKRNGKTDSIRYKLLNSGEKKILGRSVLRLGFVRDHNEDFELAEKEVGIDGYDTQKPVIPIAHVKEPFLLNEVCIFTVDAFYSGGMKLSSERFSHGLLPGMHFDFVVSLPPYGMYHVPCKVVYSKAGLHNSELLVMFKKPVPAFMELVSDYLLAHHSAATGETLRRDGFFLGQAKASLSFCSPQNEKEWQEVLELRKLAYEHISDDIAVTAEDMEDEYDRYSRHIVARSQGQVIGAIRITFPNKDLLKSEHVGMGLEIPDWLKNSDFIEMMRLCIHPDYVSTGVTIEMLKQTAKVAYESDADYLITDCVPELFSLYENMGFEKLGLTFEAYGRKDNELICVDIQKNMKGLSGNIMFFNQVLYEAVQEAKAETVNKFPLLYVHSALRKVIEKYELSQRFKQYLKRRKQ